MTKLRLRNAIRRLYQEHSFVLTLTMTGAMILASASFAILDLRHAIRETWDTHAELLAELDRIGDLQYQIQEARRSMLYSLTTNDANLQVQYAQASQDAAHRVQELQAEHLNNVRGTHATALGRTFQADWLDFLKIRDDVLASILVGDSKAAVERDLSDGVPAFNRVRNDLKEIHEQYKRQAEERMASAKGSFNASLEKLGVVLAITFLLAGLATTQVQKGHMLGIVQRSETRLREVIESINEGMFVADRAGRIELWNRAAEQISGLQRERIVGRSATDAFPDSASELIVNAIQEAIDKGSSRTLDNLMVERENEPHYLEVRVFAMEQAATVFFTDVTDRKRAEEALRSSLEELEDLKFALDQLCIVARTDRRGIITLVNDKFCSISKYSRDELVGQDHRILNSKYHPKEFMRELWTTIRSGRPWRGEIKNRAKDGTEYWVDTTIVPFRDRQGKIHQYIAIRIDITPLKRVEAELRNSKEAAEAASQAKSDFLANMSHEIRTPMNGIIGISDILGQTQLDAEQRNYVNLVSTSAHGLLTVLNDILDFSKIESGKLDFCPAPVQLRQSLVNTLKLFAMQASKKQIELTLLVADEIPEVVLADELRLRQVLNNLIGNALKFTERGEIAVRVDVESCSDRQMRLHFKVRDTGVGIAPEKLELIFQPFSQADSSITRKYGGTGLGLTISGRLVQMMGGRIWVESQVGQGSTFQFVADFGLAPKGTPPAVAGDPAQLRGLCALIVDDNETNRLILEKTLARWGIRTQAAPSAREGLLYLRELQRRGESFSLLIVDGQMPEMDGFSMVREMRKDFAFDGVTIVMLTSADGIGDGERCRELGIRAYLTKPIDADALREALLRALGHRSDTPIRVTGNEEQFVAAQNACKILLAEDNPVNQVVATRHLEKLGHSLKIAGNGKLAVAMWEAESFDLILMDVQMPEMSGYEATAAIRRSEAASLRHIPIIAMTAHAMVGDREKCIAAGMDGYVSKPIRIDTLANEIKRVLSQARGTPSSSIDEPKSPAFILNRSQLIELMDGDLELLNMSVDIFKIEFPKGLDELRSAVTLGDASRLEHAAHAIKGMLRGLGGEAPAALAQRLEQMGRNKEMESSPLVLTELEAGLPVFQAELTRLLEDAQAANSLGALR